MRSKRKHAPMQCPASFDASNSMENPGNIRINDISQCQRSPIIVNWNISLTFALLASDKLDECTI